MGKRILSVRFEVDAQRYKAGRFTMPSEVLTALGLGWEEEIRLSLESPVDGQPSIWEGVIKMVSGSEIDLPDLAVHISPGSRIRGVASRP
jgi:hypothetical protein